MPAAIDTPLRPKITIKDKAGAITYHTFDAFDSGSSDIHIRKLTLSYQMDGSPIATFRIEDSGNTLDPDVINGCKILIDLGKTQVGLTRAFAGYVRSKRIERLDTGVFEMELVAHGSKIRFNERVSNFVRIAKRTAFGQADPDFTDTNLYASNCFLNLIQDTDHLPTGEPLESFGTSGIDTIADVIPSIKGTFTDWSSIANHIAESVGAIWDVDENEIAILRFPTQTASPLRIKDTYDSADNANTSYFVGGWTFTDTIEKSQGFANRLYGRGANELYSDQLATTDTTSTALWDRHLAMQFTPSQSWNAEALAVLVHKVGTVTADLTAVIRIDNSNTPGYAIGVARIKSSLIDATATQVNFGFNTRNSSSMRQMTPGKAYWLELENIGSDVANTIFWHRDALTAGRNAYLAIPGPGTWTVQSSSYKFAFAQLSSRQVLAEATDSDSVDLYGVIEAVIDAPFIFEGRAMDKYLAAILQWTARPKRTYTIPVCTIPDTLIFPGKTAELIDTKTGFATGNTAEIYKVGYSFDDSDFGLGARFMSVELMQYPDSEKLTSRT